MDGTLKFPTFNTGLSLRIKTVGLLLVLLAVFVALLFVFSQFILLEGFEDLERDLARDDLQRVSKMLQNELATLNMVTADWAYRDDTYEFVADQDPAYIESNLLDDTFEVLQLNLILIIDPQGDIVFGKAYRLEEHRSIPLNDSLIAQYLNYRSLRPYQEGIPAVERYDSGLLLSPRGPMLVALQPILTSEGAGPARGTMIMGRYLNEDALAALATSDEVELALRYFGETNLPEDFARARDNLTTEDPRHIAILDGDTIAAYGLVNDISGEPGLIMRVVLPRKLHHEAFSTLRFFLGALVVAGLLLVLGTLLLLERQVLSRVLRLSGTVRTIGQSGGLEPRVPVAGRDEIGLLASSINRMLDTIQQAHQSLYESQLRAQRIITSISDVLYVVRVDAAGRLLEFQLPSPQLAELTGYPMAKFRADARFWMTLVHPDDLDLMRGRIDAVLNDRQREIEYRIRRADGTLCWVRDSLHPNTEPDGTRTLYGVLSDVTARKQAEAELAASERTARAFQEHLKALLDVNFELSRVGTVDALYRQIVELGHGCLGFERIALYLLEDGGTTMVGTYGIDTQGNLIDQHDLRRPVAEDPAVEAVLAQHEWTHVWEGPTFFDWGQPSGAGWRAMATLWAGDTALGWIAVDNLIDHQPLRPYQVELLSLLGTSASYLITRVQAESAVRDSEARYRALFEEATEAIFMIRGSVMVDCNSRALAMLGTTRDQIVGQPPHRFSPSRQPDGRSSREMLREKLKLAQDSGLQVFEWQHVRADGTPFDSEVSMSRVAVENEVYVQVLVRDITERKATERALRESEERYFTLFDRMPVELYRTTPEGNLLDANPALVRMLGYESVGDLKRVNVQRLYVNPDDRTRWRDSFDDCDIVRDFEACFRRRDGSTFWALNTGRVVRTDDGTIRYYEGSLRDITMRRETQDELRQSQERLDLALKVAELGLWDWYLDQGKVIYNDRWAEISGYTSEELGEREGVWPTLVHPDDWPAVNARLQAHLADRLPVFEVEYRLQRKSGEWRWILDRGKVVSRAAGGAPLRMTGTLLDITARKETEAERERMLQVMRRRAAELATVATISEQTAHILDVDDLLLRTCELIRENFDLYHVQVYLLSEEDEQLIWAAGNGAVDEAVEMLCNAKHYIPVAHKNSLVARAARERRPVMVNDVTRAADFLPNVLLPDTQSEVALPMVVGDTLIGVLDVQDNQLNRFDDQDMHIQTTLASQIAIALYNARLFSDNARRLAIIENMRDAVALISSDTPGYFPFYLNPAGLRMFGYETLDAIDDRSLDIFYAPESRATLHDEIIPTVRQKGVWRGEAVVQRRDGSVFPAEQTVFTIRDEQSGRRDIAAIIRDITVRRETETALRRINRAFRTLSECNQAMVRANDETGILREICEIIVTVGGYRMAWVGLAVDADSPALVRYAAEAGRTNGYLDTLERTPDGFIKLRGPAYQASVDRAPAIVRDITTGGSRESWREAALQRGYHATVALPVLSGENLLGVLNVYADAQNAFGDDEITLLGELASDLAFGVTGLRMRLERQAAVRQLRENEANLSALIENTTAAIWSLDRDLRLVTANSNAQQVFPFILDSDPEPDTNVLESIKPALRDDMQAQLERALNGERFMIERDFTLGDPETDTVTSYEIWFSPIRSGTDAVTGVTVFATNVTRRKQDKAQLAQRNRQLVALYDAGHVLAATLDETEIYRVLYHHVVQPVFGAETLIVARYDREDALLRYRFAITGGAESDHAGEPVSLGDDPASMTIRTGKARIVTLPESDDADGHDLRSGIYIPLRIGGAVTGVFSVQHADENAFTEDDVSLLTAVASQVSVAVQNAQLFTAEHEQRTLAEALQATISAVTSTLDPDAVMDRILANLKRVVPNDAASIMLIEGTQARIVRQSGFEERGLTAFVDALRFDVNALSKFGQMVEHRQPVRIHDTHESEAWLPYDELTWIRSYIGAPVLAGDQLLGVLNVDSAQVGFFTAQHARRLQAFADQVAIAVRNAQLFAAEREQRQFAETLRDIAMTINLSQDPDSVLDELLANIKRVVPHDAATLLLLEGDRAQVACASGFAEHAMGDWVRDLSIDVRTNTIAQDVLRTGEPVIIPDTATYPGWQQWPGTEWQRSCITVPIRRETGVQGFLNLYSTQTDFFTEQHRERLQAFAYQAANAIMNVQLFAAEREQRALAEALRKTIGAINSTLDPALVMDRILDNLERVIPHDAANIMLIEDGSVTIQRAHGYAERGYGDAIANWRYAIDDLPITREVITTRQPLVVPDTADEPRWQVVDMPEGQWIRAALKAPIRLGGQVIGLLNLDSEHPGAFTQAHARLLQTFAEYAATAIRNARLYAAERDHRHFAEALRDTAAAINRTLEFDRVLDFVLANAQRVMPHDAANIMLIEDGIARVVRGYGYEKYGVSEWVKRLRYEASEMPVWQDMLTTGKPFAVPDTQQDPNWLPIPQEEWIRSSVKAPIRVEGRIIGILHLDSATPGLFTQAHAERLQAFADQAATALRNAEFFAAEHAQRTLAEALRATAEAINGTLEFDEVLERILYNVRLVVPYDSADLLLIDGDEVRIVAGSPEPETAEDRALMDSLVFTLSETPNMQRMVETGAPLALPRVEDYADWIQVEPFNWIESHIGAPIRHEGQVLGFITLNSATPEFYSAEHADRLQAFADQAAIAIRNARLYEAVQRYAVELEHRVAERTVEVEQHSAQLRAILDSITEGVMYDEKLTVKYTNRALTDLTGYAPDEFTRYLDVLRSRAVSLAEHEATIQTIYEEVERDGVWQGDFTVRRKTGSEFEAQLTVTQVRNVEGRIVGAVSVLRDISQEKELQRQKDRFIASASHELRTPLTNFKTRLYLLEAQPDKAAKHLEILNQVVNNMAELVENMLDMSRFERGVIPLHCRTTVLQKLVRDVVDVQRAETETKQIALDVELIDRPLSVEIDVQRIRQVITNLIANAINYTPKGGTITVTLDEQAGCARLRVSDTGIGIPPEQVAHIFEPFFRANKEAAEGTGLGLTIAREIVRLHQGAIDVHSVPGEGSTFTVLLDLAE